METRGGGSTSRCIWQYTESVFNQPTPVNYELTKSEEKLILLIIFRFIEQMALSNDDDVRNIVSVTVMARLGDDTIVLNNALKYLGEQTNVLSKEIEVSFGRSGNLKILDSTIRKR
ncbi:hypothetical protein [Paenibacillus illinoisensis]|uniref:DUF7674 family protein n=1 Tax=Paenibacillus illinoisensis TaxID=59845 RepID=UPI001C8EF5D2|nr:hypothetical protein [Paenibacillus illinoisensis]MBY0217846.1 hypothetical protein [Paenibacillus illinoisensis]